MYRLYQHRDEGRHHMEFGQQEANGGKLIVATFDTRKSKINQCLTIFLLLLFSNEMSSISLKSEPWEPFKSGMIYFLSKYLSFFSMKKQQSTSSKK